MKRRNRLLTMWMLTAIWLCVQSPWALAQRVQARAAFAHAAMIMHDAEAHPCHGEHAAESPAKLAKPAAPDCCADGQCDGHCAQLSVVLIEAAPPFIIHGAMPLSPANAAGVQGALPPEFFRPPI